MSITEYNHEKTMRMLREESYEDGRIQMLIEMLKESCETPAELEDRLRIETDENKINKCMKTIIQSPKEELIDKIIEILNE